MATTVPSGTCSIAWSGRHRTVPLAVKAATLFAGRGMTAALLTGTAAVLTGAILVWPASPRRRRATPRA